MFAFAKAAFREPQEVYGKPVPIIEKEWIFLEFP